MFVCVCVLTVASCPGRLQAGRFCECWCECGCVGVCLPWQAALAGYKQVGFVSVGVWVCAYRGKLPWQATSR